MLDVIDQFREKEARDELGIGVVRDAFADMFFPGTSTIQTRARYFLLVPWIYRSLERKRVATSKIVARARWEEIRLIRALIASEDSQYVIGRYAQDSLKRLPSSVYWQGMRVWGILEFPGSQDQYHRHLDAFYASLRRAGERTDDGEPLNGLAKENWHEGLPEPPRNFLSESSFKLTHREAVYLRERILASCSDTLIAFLVDRGEKVDQAWFPWEHPQFGEFPDHVQAQLHHARSFSEAIHGAALLYNLMLSKARMAEELERDYLDRLREWAEKVGSSDALADWDRREFWRTVGSSEAEIPRQTRDFIDAWLDLALAPGKALTVESDERACTLIRNRERFRKRGKARLTNRRALELWGGAAGADQLVYRWPGANLIVSDILDGLEREGDA